MAAQSRAAVVARQTDGGRDLARLAITYGAVSYPSNGVVGWWLYGDHLLTTKVRQEGGSISVTNSPADALRSSLGSQTNDKSVHAQAVLKVILSAPEADRAQLLAIALIERDSVPKLGRALPNKGLVQDEWDSLAKSYSDLVSGALKAAFFQTTNALDFAREILRLLDFLRDEKQQTYGLAKSLWSPYVPYHQLPGTPVHMTDLQYTHLLDGAPDVRHLIDYILRIPFDEWTESSSMLLQVIDSVSDTPLRVALLAHALIEQRRRIRTEVLDNVGMSDGR